MRRQWLLICSLEVCVGFQPQLSTPLAATELPEMDELPSMEPFSHDLNTTHMMDEAKIRDDINISSTVDNDLPLSPPLTFNKFLTLQDKRVMTTIRYTGGCGLKPYYLTAAKKIKASHPDVVIEKRILPALAGEGEEKAFEILVDGKVVVGSQRSRKQRGVVSGDGGVYVSMQELDLAISKARRKHRPSTLYGEDAATDAGMRLEMLRKSQQEETETDKITNEWND